MNKNVLHASLHRPQNTRPVQNTAYLTQLPRGKETLSTLLHRDNSRIKMVNIFEYLVSSDRKFFIPHLFVSCASMVSNSILIYALRKRKKLGVITFKLIYVLSIVDVFSGIANVIASVALELEVRTKYEITRRICTVVLYPFNVFTTLMILLIAVDRYLHMTRMNNYSSIMTHRRANILVAFCALSALFNAGIMEGSYHFDFYEWFLTALCAVGIVSIIASFILYYTALRSLTKCINNESLATQNRNIRNAEREDIQSSLLDFNLPCVNCDTELHLYALVAACTYSKLDNDGIKHIIYNFLFEFNTECCYYDLLQP